MTAPACSRRRACGGPFAASALRTCAFSTAAFQPGMRRDGPSRRANRARARRAASRPGSTRPPSPMPRRCKAALANGSAQVVDSRPADRFRGEAPEPRAGVRSGHMPGSRNVPFTADRRERPPQGPGRPAGRARRGGRRSRAADHHELRLRRLRLHHEPRARDDGSTGARRSTTAHGPSGARATTCRSRRAGVPARHG